MVLRAASVSVAHLLSLPVALPISARRMASPLFARPEPEWFARSGVFNRVGTLDPDDYPGDHRALVEDWAAHADADRKSTRLNSSHLVISYAVFCLEEKRTVIRLSG